MVIASMVLALIVALTTAVKGAEPPAVDYIKQVKPLLSLKCYSCHGSLKQQSGLRLETRALMLKGGESGPAIIPGKARESRLLHRISAMDCEQMPPTGEGARMTEEEINLIRRWIDQGAAAPNEPTPLSPRDHWSFRPLTRPPLAQSTRPGWSRNPIDNFISRRQEKLGLVPQVEASREILLRRLSFDLIGLPPSAEEIARVQGDQRRDWYERIVDRLLNDPRHGERWGRHWMDVWRYSDWSGFGGQLRSSQKHIWHWRDWIVESLNADEPYDEMIRLMLAADELYPNDLDKLRASGYLARNYVLFNRNQWMDEVVEHVSKGFLGLSMKCAKCHDHKYDPIAQHDYYAMRAFFEPYHVRLDVVPGQPDLTKDAIPRAFEGLVEKPTYRFVRGDEKRPDKSKIIRAGVPNMLAFGKLKIQPVLLPLDAWQPERRPWVTEDQLRAARRKVAVARKALASPGTPRGNATTQKLRKRVAECEVDLAEAELDAVRRRVEALRASWVRKKPTDGTVLAAVGKNEREKVSQAIRAERRVAIARAQRDLAMAESARNSAAAGQKPAATKKRDDARKALKSALSAEKRPIRLRDRYLRIVGAKWTPTRFFKSTKDDPTVAFVPQSSGRRTALAKWITDPRNPLTARVAVNHLWTRHFGRPLVPSVFDFGRNGKPPTHPALLDWLAVELQASDWRMKHIHRLIVTSATYRMSSSTAGRSRNIDTDPDNLSWWRRNPIRLESQAVRDSILAHARTLDLARGGPSVPSKDQDKSTRRSLYFFHSANERNPFLTVFDEAMVKECYQREQSIVPQQALALSNSKLVHASCKRIAKRLSLGPVDDRHFIKRSFLQLLGVVASEAEILASIEALHSWEKLPRGDSTSARSRLIWALINHNDFVTLR